mmetsp:Transcript_41393/g.30432  ORF Transcript_41393/g.30432 Transcript_41393/m.30432 type:complete len:90 (+) Transcript_41393:1236-1505(+)
MLAMLGFFAFVVVLFVFHTILISKNLTSWEYLRWMQISYTKVWPRKYGSPFSKGSAAKNFKQFFQLGLSRQRDIHQWVMPSKLPKLASK